VPLAYLAVRMVKLAGIGARRPVASSGPTEPAFGRRWLIAGIVVLGGVHLAWTLDSPVGADIGHASVLGASRLLHGRALYGADRAQLASLGYDPHYDTDGPANYEAYVPFAPIASSGTAARLAAAFFDFLSAGLLFLLGLRVRGPTAGVLLAYAWLGSP
jgi:hypothetical protein